MSNKDMTSDADKWTNKFADKVAGKTVTTGKSTSDKTHAGCVDKKVRADGALPFLKWTPWLLVLAVVSFILEPTVRSLELLWPVILVLGTISSFMVYLKKTGRTYAQVAVTFPIIGKVVSGAFILAVLGSIILLIKWAVLTYMVDRLGISVRYSYMMAIGASPFVLSGIWYIFKEQLPGKPIAVFFGSLLIAKALIVTLIFINYQSPEGFVDHKNGNTLKWYSQAEDRLYSSDGVDGFGNKLVPAVEAMENPDNKISSALTRKTDDEKVMWKLNVIDSDGAEGLSHAIVTRTVTQLVIRCFKSTMEIAVFNGISTDGKTYSGTWNDLKASGSTNKGKFVLEFPKDGSAVGTLTKEDGTVLTIDLRRYFIK